MPCPWKYAIFVVLSRGPRVLWLAHGSRNLRDCIFAKAIDDCTADAIECLWRWIIGIKNRTRCSINAEVAWFDNNFSILCTASRNSCSKRRKRSDRHLVYRLQWIFLEWYHQSTHIHDMSCEACHVHIMCDYSFYTYMYTMWYTRTIDTATMDWLPGTFVHRPPCKLLIELREDKSYIPRILSHLLHLLSTTEIYLHEVRSIVCIYVVCTKISWFSSIESHKLHRKSQGLIRPPPYMYSMYIILL